MPKASRDRSLGTFARIMSLRSQRMNYSSDDLCESDCAMPRNIWRGRGFPPKNGAMTDPTDIATMREGMASEHRIPSGVRPIQEEYIPDPRPEMISGSPNPVLASRRQKRKNSSRMNSTLQRFSQTQATFHAPSDHERKYANRPMHLGVSQIISVTT